MVDAGRSVCDGAESRGVLCPWVWAVVVAVLGVHLATAGGYGIFRDELYYIACSERLDWGYVDHPPLSIAFLAAWRAVFGDSLVSLRIPPAMAHAAVCLLFGMIGRELGAGRFAQGFAALAAAVMPVYLGTSSFYSMNAFDTVFWAVAVYILCGIVARGRPHLWWVFGAVCGLGLQNKFSVGFLGMALVLGMLFTAQRKQFLVPQLYFGGAVALLLFLPHLVWMARHDWLTLEFMRNASADKNAATNPIKYFGDQLLMAHPILAPVWIAGVVYGWVSERLRPYRMFAIMFVTLFLFFSMTNGKSYYLAPAYALVMPAGAMAIERFTAIRGQWLRPAAAGLVAVAGAVLAPLAVPLLSPDALTRYQERLGISAPREEHGHTSVLSQHFSDRFGWKELAEAVAEVYRQLPEHERAKCAILCSDYGEAGAIDFFGKELGLPPAIATHNNYWIWGPRNASPDVIIVVGGLCHSIQEMGIFESGGEVARRKHPYALEGNVPIGVFRGLTGTTVEELWANGKDMI